MNPPDRSGTTPPPAAPAGRKITCGRPPYALLGTLAYLCFGTASHRPYRPALGPEAAIREIQRQSGVQLDPNVVDVCLPLHRAGQLNVTDSAD